MLFLPRTRELLIAAAVLLLTACGGESPQESLTKINAALKQNEYRSAEILGKSLLSTAADNNDQDLKYFTRLQLARLYFQFGDLENSVRFYDVLEWSTPASTDINRNEFISMPEDWHQWLMAALETNKEALSKRLIQHPKAPFTQKERELYELHVLARKESQDLESLIALMSEPRLHASVYAHFLYAQLLATQNAPAALAYLQARSPQLLDAQLFLAKLLYQQGRRPEALQYYEAYLKTRQGDVNARMAATMTALEAGSIDSARQQLKFLQAQAADHSMVLQLQATLAFEEKRYPEAAEYAQRSLGAGLDSYINHLIAGVGAYQARSWEQANSHLTAINDYLPEQHFARKMLTVSKLQLEDAVAAAKVIENSTLDQEIDVALANSVSLKLIQQGQFNEAKRLQQRVAGAGVEQETLQQQSAQLEAAIKRNDFKQSVIASGNKRDAKAREKLRAVLVYLADGEISGAKNLVDEWMVQQPKELLALNAAALVAEHQGNVHQQHDYVNQALAIDKQDIPSLVMALNLSSSAGELKKTLHISRLLMDDLKQVTPVIYKHWLWANHFQKIVVWPQALSYLKGIDTKNTDELETVLLAFLAQTRRFEPLDEYLETQGDPQQWSLHHWVAAIESNLGQGRTQEAADVLRSFIASESFTNNEALRVAVISAARTQRYELVFSAVERADELGLSVKNRAIVLATAHLNLGNVELARSTLMDQPARTPMFYEVEAQLLLAENQHQASWDALERAAESGLSYSILEKMHHVGKHIRMTAKVREYVQDYFATSPNDTTSRRRIAFWFMEDNPRFAIGLLDVPAMTEQLKQDWVTTNNLAMLYQMIGNKEKAKAFAQHAIAHAPDRAEVIDTYEEVFGHKPNS